LIVSNLFPPEFLGGYELGCSHMATALRRTGHDVRVVTAAGAGGHSDADVMIDRTLDLAPIYQGARLDASHPAVREQFHVASCFVNCANVRTLAQIIRDYKPDVAYLWNLLGLGGLGILGLLRHLGIPWVWHIMDMIPRQLCGVGGDAIPQVAQEFGLLGQGRYIVCSTHVAEEIRAGGLNLGAQVHLMPNWVTNSEPSDRSFFRGGELRIMSATGLLGEHKGTHLLIETAARLHDLGYANFIIDIYGREEPIPRFRAMLHDHDVAGTVRLMGGRTQPELLRLYPAYDLFAFPTWEREPFGFAPLEAAACGCVSLFTADCGIAEWLVDGVHCLKASRSAAEFAERIVEILTGKIDLEVIGRRSQAVVCQDFHLDTVAPAAEALLSEAAHDPPKRRRPVEEFHKLARFADGLLPVLLAEAVA
jgi:glycosyltransferase involved in cell wall biosynthesis